MSSLPTRGAWIEIASRGRFRRILHCRSPHGERGLKYHRLAGNPCADTVAPHTGSVD